MAIAPGPPQRCGGVYIGRPAVDRAEIVCALFEASQLKEGGSFYFSLPSNPGGPNLNEVVTMTNFTSETYDLLEHVDNFKGNRYNFGFTIGGTQYTGILSDGGPYPPSISDFRFYPTSQQEREATLDNRLSDARAGAVPWNTLRVWIGFGLSANADSNDFSGEDAAKVAACVVTPLGIGDLMPILLYWTAGSKQGAYDGTQIQGSNTPGRFWISKHDSVFDLDEGNKELSVAMEDTRAIVKSFGLKFEKFTATQQFPRVDTHHHDLTPPKPALESRTMNLMRPQVSPVLSRILDPMPFPSTLVETLTHTASFVDQAGYLAKYAVDRYAELDKAYHASKEEITTSSKENKELKDKAASNESELKRLTDENKADKDKLDALGKSLADARDAAAAREADLTKTVQELQKAVSQGQEHDAADDKALDDAQKAFKEEEAEKNQLKKALDESEAKVVASKSDNEALNKRLQEMTKKYSDVAAEVSDLNGKLEAENAENTQLKADNKNMKDKIPGLEKQLADATKALARAQEDLKQAQSDLSDNDGIIEDLERGFEGAKKDRDAKKRALEELKKRTDETIKDLQDQITAAQAHDLEDHKTIVGLSDKLNQANAPNAH